MFMGFEYAVLDFINDHIRCGILDPIMAASSYFAHWGIGWIVLGLILLIPRKTRTAAAVALCAMAIGAILGEGIIKHLVMRPRPYTTYESFHGFAMPFSINGRVESGMSFPSGHTCASFASATAYFKISKRAGICALLAAILSAFSRMYNYAHFLTDVLCGAALGIVCALFVMWIFKKFSIENKLLSIKKR